MNAARFIALAWALAGTLVCASTAHAQDITVTDPWVRATVPGQDASGAFMRIESARPLTLVGAASPLAATVEVHEMTLQDNIMRMRAVRGGLALQAGQPLELKPGGYHVMLMGLKKPLVAGETVLLELRFEDRDKQRRTVEVNATVRALNAAAPGAMPHMH